MILELPVLTAYDPPGTSEGSLDPLGLYVLADELATRLVPGVRERMLRVRFLTPITVGALVTEDLEPNRRQPRVLAYLVWEWLVVEAIVRSMEPEKELWGIPGSSVTRKAINEHGYVDERSYLKTPRVFGFHGVYKRLAVHLGLVDSHLRLRERRGEELIRAWAQDLRIGSFGVDHPLCQKWRRAVETSLQRSPVRTRTPAGWKQEDWKELAMAFAPYPIGRRERKYLVRLLRGAGDTPLGALVPIWDLLTKTDGSYSDERSFHRELRNAAPQYAVLLNAIATYEAFCRNLTDAFDILRAEGGRQDVRGFQVSSLGQVKDFRILAERSHMLYEKALQRVGAVDATLEAQFTERFSDFSEPVPPEAFATALCGHHESVQRYKSPEGKRAWFDRISNDRIYVRQNYRVERKESMPERYVHEYRTEPIARFYDDLR